MELLSASSPNRSKGSFSLKSAMHNSTMMNSPLANMSRTANHANENISSKEITGLYVRNVPLDMMNDDLGNVFKQHGRVLSVFIKKTDNTSFSSTFAILKVPSKREAVKMIECVNGIPPFKFRVEIALTEEEKNRRRTAKETSDEVDDQVDEVMKEKESAIRTILNSIPKPKLSESPAKGIGRGIHLRDSIEKQSAKIFPKVGTSIQNASIYKLPLDRMSPPFPEVQTSLLEAQASIPETQTSFPEAQASFPGAQASYSEVQTRPEDRNLRPEDRTSLKSPRSSISVGSGNRDFKKSNETGVSSVLRRECIRCKSPANSRCGICKASYCSPECQHDDWFYHKKACSKPPPLEQCPGYVRVGRIDSTKLAECNSATAVSCHREDETLSYQIGSVWSTLEQGSTYQGYITAMDTIESFSMLVFVEEAHYLIDDGSATLTITPSEQDFRVKVGDFIASYSESDGTWCRSYVFAVREGEYGVYQIDFGFPEIVTKIKPLPDGPCSHLASIGMHCLLNDASQINGDLLEETILQNAAVAFKVSRKDDDSLLINILSSDERLDSNLYQVLPWYRCIPTNIHRDIQMRENRVQTNETDASVSELTPVVRESAPPVIREPAPPVVREPAPPVVREPAPPVVREPAPLVVREPAPLVVREPAPLVVREPAPLVVREPAPLVVREPAPLVVREPAPLVVREPAAPVVREPAPPAVREPVPPSVDVVNAVDSTASIMQSILKPSIERFIGSAIPQIELSVGEECPVIAVWHEQDTVYMQITLETNLLTFQTLMSTIHEHCTSCSPIPSVTVGELVCAYIENDGMWYRARITRVAKDQSKAKVCMLDFGNSEVLPLTSLRPFDKQLLETPQMSIRVNLAHPEDPEKTLTGVEARLAKLCSESEGNDKMVVKHCQRSEEMGVTYNVSIHCSGVCINEELCPKDIQETQNSSAVAVPPTPTNDAIDLLPPNMTYDECDIVPLTPGDNKELVILDVTNTHTIMVMPADSIGLMETLEQVSVKMNEYCNKQTVVYYKPTEGDILLVKYSQDGLWYRAACIVSGEDSATVQFVDYGNIEEVLFDCIVRMVNEFVKPVPFLASHTILEGCGDMVNEAVSARVKQLLPPFTMVSADAVSPRDKDTYTYKITLNNVLSTLKQEGLV